MSFAAELNDFVKGFQAGDKAFSNMDDRAYKKMRTKVAGLQGDLLSTKIRDANDPALMKMNRALIGARTGYLGAMADRLRNGPRAGATAPGETFDGGGGPTVLPDVTPPAAPSVGPTSALEAGDMGDEEDTTAGTQFAAEGGKIVDQGEVDKLVEGARAIGDKNPTIGAIERLEKRRVKGYAEGGLVEGAEDDEEDGGDETIPEGASATEGQGSYGGYSVQAAHDAVQAALQAAPAAYGLNAPAPPQQPTSALGGGAPAANPQRAQRVRAYMSGAGAPSPELMKQVYAKVDPENKLTESQRVMAAMSAVRQFYLRQGNVQKANNAVLGMLQQHRINYMHYSALAKAAAEGGNLDGAATFASKAYASVPTGKDVKIVNENGRLVYTATDDATGKVIRKGIMTPQELGAAITGFTPDKFDSTLAELAGQKPAKGAAAPRGEKPTDLKTREGLIQDVTRPREAGSTATDPRPAGAPGIDVVESFASGMLQRNKGVTTNDAIQMAKMLVDPKVPLPKPTPKEGGAEYRFKGGPKFFLSDDEIERFTERRMMNTPAGEDFVGSSRAKDDPMADPKDLGEMGGATTPTRPTAAGPAASLPPRRGANPGRIAAQASPEPAPVAAQPAPARTSALPYDDAE